MATGIIATITSLFHKPISVKPKPTLLPAKTTASSSTASIDFRVGVAGLLGSSLSITLVGSASALVLPSLSQLSEPSNALSLPTWAVHVSSVVEWITAMTLVWQYGERFGFESWKGLSWAMVPLLGGAFCACTWHFFYNVESLEVLVTLQAALTVLGNATMCIAAFRINKSSDKRSNKL